MKKTARTQVDDAVEGPAVIGPDHVRDRVLSARAGARPGWSRLTVYEKEFRLGHMTCKAGGAQEEGRALDRYVAARWRQPSPEAVRLALERGMGRASCYGGH